MKIFFKQSGDGFPLLILHGLFGMSDNWATLSKSYVENGFTVYAIDQRNHGRSDHSFIFNYEAMADDLFELTNNENLSKVNIIGHSMGGKTAMQFTLMHPELVNKLVVGDISPGHYPPHHKSVLLALNSVDLKVVKTRKEVETMLRISLKDEGTIQFLLKNLYWKNEDELDWRFALKEIEANIDHVGDSLPGNEMTTIPTLFLRGERSGYINEENEKIIRERFSNSTIETISNAGHWLHAENPTAFLVRTLIFFNDKNS